MNSVPTLFSTEIESILLELSAFKNSAKLLLADYRNEKKLLADGFITDQEFIDFEQSISRRIASLPDEPEDLAEPHKAEKGSVFLSYNHHDISTAIKIKDELAKHQVRVRMDYSDVNPGDSIQEFIIQQTRSNNAIMMLVSKNSLASSWVSYEINLAIFNLKVNEKKIITVSTDGSFEDNSMSEEIYRRLEENISKVEESLRLHTEKGRRARHLEDERNRLKDAHQRLDLVLQHLRSVSVKNISGADFEATMSRIAENLIK